MICNSCQIFITDVINYDFGNGRWKLEKHGTASLEQPTYTHVGFTDLTERARTGCRLCNLMFMRLGPPPAGETYLHRLRIRASLTDTAIFNAYIPRDNGVSMSRYVKYEFYQLNRTTAMIDSIQYHEQKWTDMLNTYREVPLRQAIDGRPDSDANFGLAKAWLRCCVETHSACTRGYETMLPTRIIDVGPADGSKEPYLLVSNGRIGRYATLTHCWGTKRRLVTTTANLWQHQRAIPLATMAATFRDTVTATRKLGLRYLWIDCLCILQDSVHDWRIESAKMSAIYENSTVTISALSARDSHDGLFYREKWPVVSITTPTANTSKGMGNLQIRPVAIALKEAITNSQLNKRGWVLQERILTPAILHYGKTAIYWECRSCISSEAYPNLVANQDGLLKNILSEANRDSCTNFPQGHYIAWYIMLERYCRKSLTVPSDKLPAILGLANRFRKTYGSTHLAGLWYEDLHRGLLWARRHFETVNRDVHEQLSAPSWSWVSAKFLLNFEWFFPVPFSFHPVIRIPSESDMILVDAAIHRPASDRRDEAIRGFIQMWGVLVKVNYRAQAPKPHQPRVDRGYGLLARKHHSNGLDLPCIMDFDIERLENIWCLRIAVWEGNLSLNEQFKVARVKGPRERRPQPSYYLVLRRARPLRLRRHPSDIGKFERIGIGADKPTKVDNFFGSAEKQFLTLI